MSKPENPYKYHVCVRDIDSQMHHVRVSGEETMCGHSRGTDWIELWITQEQLDAMPYEKWCRGCLFELER